MLARSYLKSSARRDFPFRFSFSKSIAPPFFGKDLLAVLPTGFGESIIFQFFVLGCEDPVEDRNRLCKHCRYFPVAKDNIMSKQTRYCRSLLRECRRIASYSSAEAAMDKRLTNFIIKTLSLINSNIAASLVTKTWARLDLSKPACRVCSEFKVTSFALRRYNKYTRLFFSLGLMSVGFMSLDDLLSIIFLSVDAALSCY